uniref:Putative secreted protein n=1 Tax=Ixodes ricinus TaxID=34613 RepID=A0A6B0UBE8_IXORI
MSKMASCMACMAGVMATRSSTTSGFRLFREAITSAWNLGHRKSFLTNRLRIIRWTWQNPYVKATALSDRPLMKPVLFFFLSIQPEDEGFLA